MKAARILGLMFAKCGRVDASKNLGELMQSLLDLLAANRKDVKLKQAILPALGEVLCFVSSHQQQQQQQQQQQTDNWTVPSLTYVTLLRNLSVSCHHGVCDLFTLTHINSYSVLFSKKDDALLNHIVCRVVANVASSSGHANALATHHTELLNSIWNCYVNAHSGNENLRVDALNV